MPRWFVYTGLLCHLPKILFFTVECADSLFSILVLYWSTEPGKIWALLHSVLEVYFDSSLFKTREFPLITGMFHIKEDH